ncbi:MAG TPA: cytochrome b N-terminal domain-containing protein [Candidatus Dormibacteraeota bacterium]|nr:cytochrome b N-terminal domain-containing protein [Candidatus Dormibacteraeota bacterium]
MVTRWLTRPFKSKLRGGTEWFEDRTGATELLHKGLYEAVPKKGGWAYALGSATLALILLQLFSGIFLLLDYVPSVNDAFNSLDYLRSSDAFGAWVRGLHLWGSYTLIFVIGLHMLRTFLSASYKRPRELNWVSGAVLFFLVLGLAITGAMLPWDQAAYWTTVVVTNIPHYLPFIGNAIRTLWRGGDFVGPITLTRTFAIHIWVLPFLLLSFIGAHLYLLRRHGEFGAWVNYDTDPGEDEEKQIGDRIRRAEPPYPTKRIERRYAAPTETVGFFPNQLFKDVALSTGLIAVIFVMGLISGAPLDGPSDPATLTYVPTPEWFFLPLDQFLVVAPSSPLIAIGVFGVLGIGAALLLFLPFIDRSVERRPLRRPEVIIPALFMVFTVVFFAILGINRLYNL